VVKGRLNGEVFAITAAILWGVNYQVVKTLLRTVPEGHFLVIRFVLAIVLLALLLLTAGENLKTDMRDLPRILILGLLGVGVYNILWTYGVHLTTASDAALLISTSPVFAGIYGVIGREEILNRKKWAGIILSFLGIFAINCWTPGSHFSLESQVFTGNLLILLGALLFALYAVLAKPLLQRYSPQKLTALAMAWGLPILIPFGLLQRPVLTLTAITPMDWLAFFYVVVLGTVIAFVLWYKGIKETTPVKTVVFLYLTPVVSMISGLLWFGERMSAGQIAGAVLVLLGLIVFKVETAIHLCKKPREEN
jgi:drug/metabolite transporter (DMT)-like permease